MNKNEKVKTINNKVGQNKAQYNLDRQTAKISALSSGNFSKYEFLTGKDVLSQKDLLEKAAAWKRFEYSPLGSVLKKQTSVVQKQYQGLNKLLSLIKTKNQHLKCMINQICYITVNTVFKNFDNLSFRSRYSFLAQFFNDLNKFNKLKTQKQKRKNVYDTAS